MPIAPANQVAVFNPNTGRMTPLSGFEMPPVLPELSQIMEVSGGSPVVRAALGAEWALKSANTWQIGSQLTLGSLVSNVGVPFYDVFDAIMGALGRDVSQDFTNALLESGEIIGEAIDRLGRSGEAAIKGAIEAGLDAGVGLTVNFASAIPIVGWVVKIAWSLGRAIKNIVDIVKKQNEVQVVLYSPSAFTADGDNIVFNQFYLPRVRDTVDWTRVFLPPGIGKGGGGQKAFGRQFLEGDGIRVITTNPTTGALGNVPGTGWNHQSIELFGGRQAVEPGGFLPSVRGQAGWLWEHALMPGPAMYCIEAPALEAQWGRYLYDLRVYLIESKDMKQSAKSKVLRFWEGQGGVPIFGWLSAGGGSAFPGATIVKDEWERYRPVVAAKRMGKLQRKMLDTIVVAYLDETYAAVNRSRHPEMYNLWQTRRKQLLAHPARCEVDLTNVPDPEYRQALRDSGVGFGMCLTRGLQTIASGPKPTEIRGISHVAPRGHDRFPTEGDTAPRTRGMGKLPVLAAGAGAGLYFAHKAGLLAKLGSVVR